MCSLNRPLIRKFNQLENFLPNDYTGNINNIDLFECFSNYPCKRIKFSSETSFEVQKTINQEILLNTIYKELQNIQLSDVLEDITMNVLNQQQDIEVTIEHFDFREIIPKKFYKEFEDLYDNHSELIGRALLMEKVLILLK